LHIHLACSELHIFRLMKSRKMKMLSRITYSNVLLPVVSTN